MLQVGVHHGDVARLARQHALDAGAGEPAPADAADAAHAAVGRADRARGRRGAVGRVVVDEDDFPVDAGKRARELLHQQRNVVALLERRNDDAQFGRRTRRAGACADERWGNLVHRAGDIAMRPPLPSLMDARPRAIERPAEKPAEPTRSPPLRHVFNETIVRLVDGPRRPGAPPPRRARLRARLRRALVHLRRDREVEPGPQRRHGRDGRVDARAGARLLRSTRRCSPGSSGSGSRSSRSPTGPTSCSRSRPSRSAFISRSSSPPNG